MSIQTKEIESALCTENDPWGVLYSHCLKEMISIVEGIIEIIG